jgi:hypothetical protein
MEGFKPFKKVQCFKEGGSVAYKSRKSVEKVDEADIKQDKAIVKKAIHMHDSQEHKGEHTDLSKLRKGGRAKKMGNLRKYKAGGSVDNEYSAKKSSGDLDNIRKVKDITPSKAAAPSKATQRPALKGSDVEKEKNKPAGDAVAMIKSKQSGKSAVAPSAGLSSLNSPAKFCGGRSVKK